MLNQIYEGGLPRFSYGFRSERGQHDALDALFVGVETRRVSFILEADIASFFDGVSEGTANGSRLVSWKTGWSRLVMGTGQGSVISPLLANIYRHYDLSAERWRRREATGDMIIVRYAAISWLAN